MEFDGSDEFKAVARQIYWMMNTTANEWQVGGYYRQSEKLTFMTIPKAGWLVEYDAYDTVYAAF